MVLSLDHRSGIPAYRQIMDQIKFQIASGVLPPLAEVPSTRALSAELSVNPMTISKAYSLLEKERVLERRRGQTLVVRAVDGEIQELNKLEQLRQSLAPSVSVARQLSISPREALKVFRALLEATEEKPALPRTHELATHRQ